MRAGCALLAALGPLATLSATAAAAKPVPTVAVVLTTAGGSGPIGTAILEQRPSGVLVTVKFAIRQPVSGKAAIYKGDCIAPGAGRPAYPLRPVEHGLSQTLLRGVSVRTLTSGRYAVVLHYQPTSLCGDLREAQPIRQSE
jgi:hypothetical protein